MTTWAFPNAEETARAAAQPTAAAVADQVARWVPVPVLVAQASTTDALQAIQGTLQGILDTEPQAGGNSGGSDSMAAVAAALTSAMVQQQHQALLAASLATSAMPMPQQPAAAEGSLTANSAMQLLPLAEVLPPLAESAAEGEVTAGLATAGRQRL